MGRSNVSASHGLISIFSALENPSNYGGTTGSAIEKPQPVETVLCTSEGMASFVH